MFKNVQVLLLLNRSATVSWIPLLLCLFLAWPLGLQPSAIKWKLHNCIVRSSWALLSWGHDKLHTLTPLQCHHGSPNHHHKVFIWPWHVVQIHPGFFFFALFSCSIWTSSEWMILLAKVKLLTPWGRKKPIWASPFPLIHCFVFSPWCSRRYADRVWLRPPSWVLCSLQPSSTGWVFP